MINIIEIKNFKSIKSKLFNLKNLNILMGLNGQGKSSFIQFLLLLRQSAESLNDGILQLNGKEVNIGNTKDALYQFANKNEYLEIKLEFDNKKYFKSKFDYLPNSDIFIENKNEKYITTSHSIKPIKSKALFGDNFQYLNANRIEPLSLHKKSYTNVILHNNIGSLGEYTVDYLDLNGSKDIEFENCIHNKTFINNDLHGKNDKVISLKNQVNLWMSEISPDIRIVTTNVTSNFIKLEYEFEQPNRGKTMLFKPENVGFGISYALHVVTALLKARKGDLLIIENPESHIHPRGQAEIGRLISLVAQNDVQLIIETHSDHILNGIRVGVKENPMLKERTILFYFEKIVTEFEQYSDITDIKIDKNGTLSNYPNNLLSEWSSLLSKLI